LDFTAKLIKIILKLISFLQFNFFFAIIAADSIKAIINIEFDD